MRRRVPNDIPPIIGKTEICRSYGTENFKEAVRRHRREMVAVDDLFAEARRLLAERASGCGKQPAPRLSIPTEDDVRAAVNRWLHEESRRRLAEEEPDDPEAVTDHLNDDEAHLARPEGIEVAARRLPAILRGFGFDNPPPALQRFALSLMRDAMWKPCGATATALKG
ncbi:hypothetical protein JYK14_22910 [Siccirubricoccus sp. KC 17139]|uniref:DUF6538 domain-containing protein n=2 Tax=Siccirubricoccus soli TaxID=2899147 RepID=A0ABT1DAM8_9PROT|nr:DUF6538 domain-containing protein [Siccirubricoccus soli]MCO6418986.1 hypothetical protein [Siccirubricoccus soli]MCP2685121.1 hypothetical protein [Siccirubricoccus soli]